MILYIAGKMTGTPDNGRAAFAEAEAQLRAKGYLVINPGRLPDDLPTQCYMPICLAMLEQADGIAMLPGWEQSRGAGIEIEYATYGGRKMAGLLEDWLNKEPA